MSITYTRAGWRWLACTGAGSEGVDVGAGVLGRRGEAAGAGGEGVDVGAACTDERVEAAGEGGEGVDVEAGMLGRGCGRGWRGRGSHVDRL